MQLDSKGRKTYEPTDSYGNKKHADLYVDGPNGQAAMDFVVKFFDDILADENLLINCTRFLTTNINESLHARLYRLCHKEDHYSYNHLSFAAEFTFTVHNHGHLRGSLSNTPGYGLNKNSLKRLMQKDIDMFKYASKPSKKRRNKALNLTDADDALYGPDITGKDKASEFFMDQDDPEPDSNLETDSHLDVSDNEDVIMHVDERHESNNPIPHTVAFDLCQTQNQSWHSGYPNND